MSRGKLLVVAGPSGVGKSTMLHWVKQNAPELWHSISMTTRPIRVGEQDGVEYFFVDESQFRKAVAEGQMLEWAEYAGHLYGTPAEPVEARLAAGQSVILEIEVQGAKQVRQRFPEATFVLLKPPSWQELERRLRGRGTEPEATIQARLAAAEAELAAEREFDSFVVLETVEQAGRELLKFATDSH